MSAVLNPLFPFRWEPSIDDMCDEYELDNSVCDFDRGSKERERARFTFNLICKADQGNMYQDENDDGEVMVSNWMENDADRVGNMLSKSQAGLGRRLSKFLLYPL